MMRSWAAAIGALLLGVILLGAAPATAHAFDASAAMRHVETLADMGPRVAGSTAERRAAEYAAAQLKLWGYSTSIQTVPLPHGGNSWNVIAERRGVSDKVLVIGAHLDTVPNSPGANDNASGVAVTLELARTFSSVTPYPTLRFILFGAEEISGPTPNDHHFGSNHYVYYLNSAQRQRIAGMLSVDMVGRGTDFHVRSMQKGPQEMVWFVEEEARRQGVEISFLKDLGSSGWSDHEAFEFAGIPAAWLQWRPDSMYHTPGDVASRVVWSRLQITGSLVVNLVHVTDERALARLRPPAPDLTNLNVYPNPVTPNGDGWADWTYFNYTLNTPATVDIKIYDVAWNLMAVPAEGRAQNAGFHSFRYDLAARTGGRLPDGVYWYSVQARNSSGSQHRGGLFFVSGGLWTAPALGTSPKLSKVWMHPNPFYPTGDGISDATSFCYTLNTAAFVTIKVIDYKGEVKTVTNNARRNKGRHYEGWNGKNDAGRPLPPGNYRYYIFATGGGKSPHTNLATGVVSIRR